MKLLELENLMNEIAPLMYAYPYDNSGINIATHNEVEKILVCLDLTDIVIDEAIDENCDTIVCHHPPIFNKMGSVDFRDPVSSLTLRAVNENLNVYAAHTSYDCAPNGLNFVLANKIGILEPNILSHEGRDYGLGMIGDLAAPMSVTQFAAHLKQVLNADITYGGAFREISRVACVGGSAGEFFLHASKCGAQAFVVGEARYNHYLEAKRSGIAIFMAGHYETEICFSESITSCLQTKLLELKYDVAVVQSKNELRPYTSV